MSVLFLLLCIVCVGSAGNVNIIPADCDLSPVGCVDALNNAAKTCAGAADACVITFAPGVYNLKYNASYYVGISFYNIKAPLTISGYGATIITWGLNGGFGFENINNIVIEGITMDMHRVPFSAGVLASTNRINNTYTQLNFKIDPVLYPFYLTDSSYNWLLRTQAIFEYDIVNQRLAHNSIDLYEDSIATFNSSTNIYSVMTASKDQFFVGHTYVLRHQVYSFNNLDFTSVYNISIVDVTLLATPGMGVFAQYSSDIELERVQIKKVPGRPLSLCADAVHFDMCMGSIQISNSFFEGQGDDGLNIHGDYLVITNIVSSTQIQYSAKYAIAVAGDMVEIRDGNSFDVIHTNQILSITPDDSKGHHMLSDRRPGGILATGTITLKNPLPSTVKPNSSFLASLTHQPTDVTLLNNYYKANRARGQLLTTPNTYVRNNTYERMSMTAVLVLPDNSYWYQANALQNLTIVDSIFIYPDTGDQIVIGAEGSKGLLTTGSIHSNIAIVSNTFFQMPSQIAVQCYTTDGLVVSQNHFNYNQSAPKTNFDLAGNTNVKISNNVCTLNGAPTTCN